MEHWTSHTFHNIRRWAVVRCGQMLWCHPWWTWWTTSWPNLMNQWYHGYQQYNGHGPLMDDHSSTGVKNRKIATVWIAWNPSNTSHWGENTRRSLTMSLPCQINPNECQWLCLGISLLPLRLSHPWPTVLITSFSILFMQAVSKNNCAHEQYCCQLIGKCGSFVHCSCCSCLQANMPESVSGTVQ